MGALGSQRFSRCALLAYVSALAHGCPMPCGAVSQHLRPPGRRQGHYIHHTRFSYNFGSLPFWDYILGTRWPGDDAGKAARAGAGSARAEDAAAKRRRLGAAQQTMTAHAEK